MSFSISEKSIWEITMPLFCEHEDSDCVASRAGHKTRYSKAKAADEAAFWLIYMLTRVI